MKKREIPRLNKRSQIVHIIWWALFIAFVTFIWFAAIKKPMTDQDYIGQDQLAIMQTAEKAEKIMLYIDQAAKITFDKDLKDIASNGGTYSFDGGFKCGDYYGYALWQTVKDGKLVKCIPEDISYMISSSMKSSLNAYFDKYPSSELRRYNPEYSLVIKDGILKATTRNPLEFQIAIETVKDITEDVQNQKELDAKTTNPDAAKAISNIIEEQTQKYYNTEYTLGGHTPGSGIDCSGWVYYLVNYIRSNYNLDNKLSDLEKAHGPAAQDLGGERYGTMISESDLRPGDMILLDRPSGGTGNWMAERTWDHVVMVYDKSGEMWVSESSGGSHLKDSTLKDFLANRRSQQAQKPGYKIGFARTKELEEIYNAIPSGGGAGATTGGTGGGKTVVIDPGHGTKNSVSGAPGEADIVMSISEAVKQKLEAAGFKVVMTHQKTDKSEDLGAGQVEDNIKRADIANQNNAALYFRIHGDADNGRAAMYYPAQHPDSNIASESKKAAEAVWSSVTPVISKAGFKYSQGILTDAETAVGDQQGGLLTGSKASKVPTALIEIAPLSSSAKSWINSNKDAYAKAIADGIANYLGKPAAATTAGTTSTTADQGNQPTDAGSNPEEPAAPTTTNAPKDCPAYGGEIDFTYLISDQDFTNKDAATPDQIQKFLENMGGDVKDPVDGVLLSKAVYEAGQKYNLNPIMLLATLQKEQSLITKKGLTQKQKDYAAGCGCPDTGSCNPAKKGLSNQMECMAQIFQKHYNTGLGNKYPYTFIQLNYDNKRCQKGQPTQLDIKNAATYSLYKYTPHTYDYCLNVKGGANFNFRNLFVKYYKEITGGLPTCTATAGGFAQQTEITDTGEEKVYIVKTIGKYIVYPSFSVSTGYDLNGFDTVKKQVQGYGDNKGILDLVPDCERSGKKIDACVAEAVKQVNERQEMKGSGVVMFNGPCDPKENLWSDFVEDYGDCLKNGQTGCYCDISIEQSEQSDFKDKVKIKVYNDNGVMIKLDDAKPIAYRFNKAIDKEDTFSISKRTAAYYLSKSDTIKVDDSKPSIAQCSSEKRKFKFCVESGKGDKKLQYKFAIEFPDPFPPPPVENLKGADKEKAKTSIILEFDAPKEGGKIVPDLNEYLIFCNPGEFSKDGSGNIDVEGIKAPQKVNARDKDGMISHLKVQDSRCSGEDIKEGQDYHFAVVPVDISGNRGKAVEVIARSIDDLAPDRVKITTPMGEYYVVGEGGPTNMMWDKPEKNEDDSTVCDDLAKYWVYLSDNPIGDFNACNPPECKEVDTKTTFDIANNYYFAVIGVDSSGNHITGPESFFMPAQWSGLDTNECYEDQADSEACKKEGMAEEQIIEEFIGYGNEEMPPQSVIEKTGGGTGGPLDSSKNPFWSGTLADNVAKAEKIGAEPSGYCGRVVYLALSELVGPSLSKVVERGSAWDMGGAIKKKGGAEVTDAGDRYRNVHVGDVVFMVYSHSAYLGKTDYAGKQVTHVGFIIGFDDKGDPVMYQQWGSAKNGDPFNLPEFLKSTPSVTVTNILRPDWNSIKPGVS